MISIHSKSVVSCHKWNIQRSWTTKRANCLRFLVPCSVPSTSTYSRSWSYRGKKKYLQACLDQCRHFAPLWFHVVECFETKPRYCSRTKPCRKARPINQDSPAIPKPQPSWSPVWVLQLYEASRTSMYASEDHASPLWAEWANIPSGNMEPVSAHNTIKKQQKNERTSVAVKPKA